MYRRKEGNPIASKHHYKGAPLGLFKLFTASAMRAIELACRARATQLPIASIILGIPFPAVICRTKTSSVKSSCSTSVIINESAEVAAAQANHSAEVLVNWSARIDAGSVLEPSKEVPKKISPVANAWLPEIDTEMVMVAMNETIWRYAVNGGVLG